MDPVLTIVFIIGAVFYLAVDLLKLYGLNLNLDVLYIPLAVQEMAMALWLLIKWFNQAALKELLAEKHNV